MQPEHERTQVTPEELDRARALGNFSRHLASSVHTGTMADTVVTQIHQLLGTVAVLFRVSPDGLHFDVDAVAHDDPLGAELVRSIFERDPHDIDEGLLAMITPSDDALFWSEVDQDVLRAAYPGPSRHRYFDQFGLTSLMLVPVAAHGQLLGAVAVGRGFGEPALAPGDVAFVQDLADRAGLALHNMKMLNDAHDLSAQLQALITGAMDAIITIDDHGQILEWNPSAEATFGWTADEVRGQELAEQIIPPEERDAHRIGLAHANMTGDGPLMARRVELEALHRDGRRFPIELSLTVTSWHGALRYSAFLRDITARRQFEHQLTHLASRDPLTGLVNRTELERELAHQLLAPDRPLALCFVDLDGFKEVNDRHGHRAGDEVLAAVANRLESCVRGEDVVARYGGDEFVVLVAAQAGLPATEVAVEVARRITAALADPLVVAGSHHLVTASIGVAIFPRDATDPDTLLTRADAAMYIAKSAGGRGAVMFWHDADEL